MVNTIAFALALNTILQDRAVLGKGADHRSAQDIRFLVVEMSCRRAAEDVLR